MNRNPINRIVYTKRFWIFHTMCCLVLAAACSDVNHPIIVQLTDQGDTPWKATEEYKNNPIIAVVTAPPPPTPTATQTSTPEPERVQVIKPGWSGTFIYTGPGLEYEIIAKVYGGDEYEPIGRNNEGTWFAINVEDGTQGWIEKAHVETNVDIFDLPLLDIPPTPNLYTITIYNNLNRAIGVKLPGGWVSLQPRESYLITVPKGVYAIRFTRPDVWSTYYSRDSYPLNVTSNYTLQISNVPSSYRGSDP